MEKQLSQDCVWKKQMVFVMTRVYISETEGRQVLKLLIKSIDGAVKWLSVQVDCASKEF